MCSRVKYPIKSLYSEFFILKNVHKRALGISHNYSRFIFPDTERLKGNLLNGAAHANSL